jgi:hypothetical protein
MIRTKTLLKVLVDSYCQWEDSKPSMLAHTRLSQYTRTGDKLQKKLTEQAYQEKAEKMRKIGIFDYYE